MGLGLGRWEECQEDLEKGNCWEEVVGWGRGVEMCAGWRAGGMGVAGEWLEGVAEGAGELVGPGLHQARKK